MADVMRRVDVTLAILFRSSLRLAIVAARLPYGVTAISKISRLDEILDERFDDILELLFAIARNLAFVAN